MNTRSLLIIYNTFKQKKSFTSFVGNYIACPYLLQPCVYGVKINNKYLYRVINDISSNLLKKKSTQQKLLCNRQHNIYYVRTLERILKHIFKYIN